MTNVDFAPLVQFFERAVEKRTARWTRVVSTYDKKFRAARHERASSTPYLNILDVFNLSLRELKHSRVLEWFLDENESHEQGNLFLRTLGNCLRIPLENPHDYIVQRERPERVDIVAYKAREFAIFIENKVEHEESEQQFSRLIHSLVRFSNHQRIPESHRFALFLTDHGGLPVSITGNYPHGFLRDNLHPVRRVYLFNQFLEALKHQRRKSPLLASVVASYLYGISKHPGI